MTLVQMQYFQMVCLYQSVSRAAEELHVSQPSISNSIKEMEEEFGVLLFHRIKKRMVLTKEGEYFLGKVQSILSDTRELSQHMSAFGSERNAIRLGVPPMIGTILFPSMFRDFKPLYPEVQLNILEYGSRQTIRLAEEDSLDMAIVIINELSTNKFNVLPILETQIVCCLSTKHPLASCSSIAFDQLAGEPLILLKEDSYQNFIIRQSFERHSLIPNVLLYSGQLLTIEKFITNNLACSFLFQNLVSETPGIVGIPLKEPIPVQIGLIWKKDKQMYSNVSKFIEFTQKYRT